MPMSRRGAFDQSHLFKPSQSALNSAAVAVRPLSQLGIAGVRVTSGMPVRMARETSQDQQVRLRYAGKANAVDDIL